MTICCCMRRDLLQVDWWFTTSRIQNIEHICVWMTWLSPGGHSYLLQAFTILNFVCKTACVFPKVSDMQLKVLPLWGMLVSFSNQSESCNVNNNQTSSKRLPLHVFSIWGLPQAESIDANYFKMNNFTYINAGTQKLIEASPFAFSKDDKIRD